MISITRFHTYLLFLLTARHFVYELSKRLSFCLLARRQGNARPHPGDGTNFRQWVLLVAAFWLCCVYISLRFPINLILFKHLHSSFCRNSFSCVLSFLYFVFFFILYNLSACVHLLSSSKALLEFSYSALLKTSTVYFADILLCGGERSRTNYSFQVPDKTYRPVYKKLKAAETSHTHTLLSLNLYVPKAHWSSPQGFSTNACPPPPTAVLA